MGERIARIDNASAFRFTWPATTILSPGLQRTTKALIRNIERLHLLATLPTSLLGFGAILQNAWNHAVQLATDNARPVFEEGDEKNADVLSRLPEAFGKSEQHCDDDLLRRFKAITTNASVTGSLEKDGPKEPASFLEDGISIFLAAQTSLSWTVFEVTAGDLLIDAANLRTKEIGKSLATLPDEGDPKSGRAVKWSILEKHGLNLHGKLGDIFADQFLKKRRLLDLKKAYDVAFAKNPTVAAVFNKPALKALHLTRNLMAHQGGRADEIFVKAIESTGFFPGLKENDPVEITAVQASDFSHVAIESSIELLNFVEQWLGDHSE